MMIHKVWYGGILALILGSSVLRGELLNLSELNINNGRKPTGRDSICIKEAWKTNLIDSIVQRHRQQYNFNGAVLVADHGVILYENALGYADRDHMIPLQPNSVFQLASVSKQFTAMAILILKERGQLSVEDPVRKYIADFPYPNILIRHLMQHTSGLPEYVNSPAFDRYFPSDTIRNTDLVKIMHEHRLKLQFQPGSKHKYCNTGYAMLAMVIESISNMKYDDFMQQNIFQPLGMKNTYTYAEIGACPAECRVSACLTREGKTSRLNYINGDKGIHSTIHDMYLWDQALYTSRLVSPQTISEAFTPGETNNGHAFAYGYGWRIAEADNGSRLIFHRGLWQTFNPAFLRFVDEEKTIIILDNIIPPFTSGALINDLKKVLLSEDVTVTETEQEGGG